MINAVLGAVFTKAKAAGVLTVVAALAQFAVKHVALGNGGEDPPEASIEA